MIQFKKVLDMYEQTPTDEIKEDMKQGSLQLSNDASKYTINFWVDRMERKNCNR